jgi:hypothetical protein
MIPVRGARSALETRHQRWRLQSFGVPGRNLHGVAYTPAGNPRDGYPPPSELHRCLIRTGLAARVAHLIGVGGMATATWGISVKPVIQGGDD